MLLVRLYESNAAAFGVKIGAPERTHLAYMFVSLTRPYGLWSRNLMRVKVHDLPFSALNVDSVFLHAFSMIILPLLLAWLLAALTGAATLPPTLDLTSISTAPDKPLADLRAQSNVSAVGGNPWWFCTRVDRWILPKLISGDCKGVLDYFYIQTMDEGGTKRLEFIAPGTRGKSHIQVQRTPRKYIFGSVYPC